MTAQTLEYQLQDGFIQNWLAAGPWTWPVKTDSRAGEDWRAAARRALFEEQAAPRLAEAPVERGAFHGDGGPEVSGQAGQSWRYMRCLGDHLLDMSTYAPTRQYLRAWGYAQLWTDQPGPAALVVSTYGPVEVWLNGQRVGHNLDFTEQLHSQRISVELRAENELLVRFDQAGARVLPLSLAVQVEAEGAVQVRQTTLAHYPRRHQQFEEIFEMAYLETATNVRGKSFNLRFAEDAAEDLHYAYQVQDEQGMIYLEATADVHPTLPVDAGHPARLYERQYRVALQAPGHEYWEQNNRYQRNLPIYILDNNHSSQPYGSYDQRRGEALLDAARREENLFGQVARLALVETDPERYLPDPAVFVSAVDQVARQAAGSELLLVGLLGAAARFGARQHYPHPVDEPLKQAALRYAYRAEWAAPQAGIDYADESAQILCLTAAILAGQAYPAARFDPAGLTGEALRAESERAAAAWMRSCGAQGLQAWDSPQVLERILAALAHLVSFAEQEDLAELAAVLMDKLLLLLAVHGWQGMMAGSRGCAQSAAMKSAQLQASAGIARLMWGMGVFSIHIAGTVSLALSDYEFPTFFAQIAADPAQEVWARARQGAPDCPVNTVIYKTPDYLLGSAQDYRPGERGLNEQVWQAALGPDALVYTNHPVSFQTGPANQPGFWLGNGSLPRVAQWKDALVAVYQLADTDWLDFTHACFPVYAFDEYFLEEGWAFARKGEAYLALSAAQGFELVKRAPEAYRELRSPGRQNVWLCQMGRAALDGNFLQFREKVKQQVQPEWQPSGVHFTSLRGEAIRFGWQGPLTVNGQEAPLAGFKHLENPYTTADYPARQMEIGFGELLMRLNFEE